MTNQPILGKVPNTMHDLRIKADLNGITVLNDGRYRKRYTGSKRWAVDINGVLRSSTELRRLLSAGTAEPGKVKAKKEGPPSPLIAAPKNPVFEEHKNREKSYSINKPEIRQRIFAMIASQPEQKRELYFWTVTFPLKTDDGTIYRLFNIWLTTIRQKGWLKNYLWVAERQGNGTLHFHICIPHKLSVVAANREMARILANASRRREIENYSVHQAKRYNGVDIAKNRKKKKVTNFAVGKQGRRALISYITKYITKNDGKFTHLAWHNSRGFSSLFTGVTFTVQEFTVLFDLVPFVRRHSAVKNEYFTFWPWMADPPPRLVAELNKLNSFIQNLN